MDFHQKLASTTRGHRVVLHHLQIGGRTKLAIDHSCHDRNHRGKPDRSRRIRTHRQDIAQTSIVLWSERIGISSAWKHREVHGIMTRYSLMLAVVANRAP